MFIELAALCKIIKDAIIAASSFDRTPRKKREQEK